MSIIPKTVSIQSLIGRNITPTNPRVDEDGQYKRPQKEKSLQQKKEQQELKKIKQQQRKRKNHWGVEIKHSNVDTMLNLMFNHLGDPTNKPSPLIDPTRR